MIQNAQKFSHSMLQECIKPGDCVVDATMGNGNDTIFLSKLVQAEGKVFAFDIQEAALIRTNEKIQALDTKENIQLICDSHANLSTYIQQSIQAAIFNLGYLPGSDKSIITTPDSTIRAIESIMERLTIGGRIVLVCYWGHEGGDTELSQLQQFLPTLDQHEWTVLQYQFINQQNQPPICFVIERKK